MQTRQKLSEWARANGRDPRSAWTMLKEGRLPPGLNPRKIGNRWYVDKEPESPPRRCVAYLRVRGPGQRAEMERQKLRVLSYAQEQGVMIDEIVTEVGPALKGSRQELLQVLKDSATTHVLVEHRARLGRFGTEFVEALLCGRGGSLIVVDEKDPVEDLESDLVDAVESICAHLYGRESARNRAEAALQGVREYSDAPPCRSAGEGEATLALR